MYIQNRRDSSKFKGYSPLQNRVGLISLKSAIAYFAYTKRCVQAKINITIYSKLIKLHKKNNNGK